MASRFWVGGTGTWDGVTTTHWAATTGAAGGQTVPGSADTVTFDASSGGGVVTVNTTVTVVSISNGAHTGTLDFSANNNNVTLSGASNSFSGNGTGIRTLNLGNGTWTLSGAPFAGGTLWNMSTVTNLAFNANSSTIVFTGALAAGSSTFAGGGLTYNAVTFSNTGRGGIMFSGANTFATQTITAPNTVFFTASATTTITNLILSGQSASSPIMFISSSPVAGTVATISSANSPTLSWCAFRNMTFTGGGTFAATSSFDFGGNTGITISAPSTGGGLAPAPIIIGRGTPY